MAISLTDDYAVSVLSDNPDSYWRLAENSGTTFVDDGVHPTTNSFWYGGTGITRRTRHFRRVTPARDIPWGIDFSRPADPTNYGGGQSLGGSSYLGLNSATDTLTVEFIFMMGRDVASAKYFHIISKYADASNEFAGYNFGICNTGIGSSPKQSSLYFFYGDSDNILKFPSTGNILQEGNTYHIVIQKERDYLSYYLNGILVNKQILPSGISPITTYASGSDVIMVGGMLKNAIYTSGGTSPNMGISDIAIYKTPLSEEKIKYRSLLVQEATDDIICPLHPTLNFTLSENGISRVYGKGDNRTKVNWSVTPAAAWDSLIKNTYSAVITPSCSFTALTGGSFFSNIDVFSSNYGGTIEFIYSPTAFTASEQVFLEVSTFRTWTVRLTGSGDTTIGPNRLVCGPDYPQTVQIRKVGLASEAIPLVVGGVYYITMVMDPMGNNCKVYINTQFQYEVYFPNFFAPLVDHPEGIPYSDGPARLFSTILTSNNTTASYNMDNGGSSLYFFRDRVNSRGVNAKVAQFVMFNSADSEDTIKKRFYKLLPYLKLSTIGQSSSLSVSNTLSLDSTLSSRYLYSKTVSSLNYSAFTCTSEGKLLKGSSGLIPTAFSLSTKGSLKIGDQALVQKSLNVNSFGRLQVGGESSLRVSSLTLTQTGHMIRGLTSSLRASGFTPTSRMVMIIGAPVEIKQPFFTSAAYGYRFVGRELSLGIVEKELASKGSIKGGNSETLEISQVNAFTDIGSLSLKGTENSLSLPSKETPVLTGEKMIVGTVSPVGIHTFSFSQEGDLFLFGNPERLNTTNFETLEELGHKDLFGEITPLHYLTPLEIRTGVAYLVLEASEESLPLLIHPGSQHSSWVFQGSTLEKPGLSLGERPGEFYILARKESLPLEILGVKNGIARIKVINSSPYKVVYPTLPTKKTTQFTVEVTDFDIN